MAFGLYSQLSEIHMHTRQREGGKCECNMNMRKEIVLALKSEIANNKLLLLLRINIFTRPLVF